VNWDELSPEAAWTTVNIAWPISCGSSKAEVAAHLGETTGWVTKRLSALRAELERSSA
jgi:hypothetical protein